MSVHEVVRLQELVEFSPAVTERGDSDYVTFVPMPALDDVSGEIIGGDRRLYGEVKKGYSKFANGDVLFAKITPCMENGKIAVAERLEGGVGCGSTEFHVLRPYEGLEPRFLWYYLRQVSFRQAAEAVMTGAVGQRRVPLNFLRGTEFPVPPHAEQRRIVAKLNALSARSKRARAELERVTALAARAKQAVLAAAFDGRLVQATLSDWTPIRLAEVVADIRYGTAKKCHYGARGTPVLRIPNVQQGRIDLSDIKYAEFDERESNTLSLQDGDLLVIRSNGSVSLVGRAAVVLPEAVGMLFAGYLIRIRVNRDRMLPNFLHLALSSPQVRAVIERTAKSTSGVSNINSGELLDIEVPCPAVSEQEKAIAEVQRLFGRIDRLTRDVTPTIHLLSRLDQSILSRAFRGELVPQDPSDEPASVMLDRIRAEREAAGSAPKRRRRGG